MPKAVKGKKLVPGRMYTLWGKNNHVAWSVYRQPPQLHGDIKITRLYPLEPFVFLERTLSDCRYNDEDQIYDYKILTGDGMVGWLSLHDDDLCAFGIRFREYDTSDA